MCAFLPVDAFADKRVALIVGNSKYDKVAKLPNPANDAADVAEALRQLDFKVIEVEDADYVHFNKALAEFSRIAADADAVMFFYAGHGIQYDGQNYFLPVDADIKDLADVEFTSMPMSKIRQALDKAGNGIRIMVLDACRDNPLARSIVASRGLDGSASRGLARVDQQAGGMIVVYATQPNQVAQDGSDRNSPFTSAFVKRLREPGLEIGTLFRRVTSDVRERTGGKQVPEVSISLGADYYLNRSETDVLAWGRVRDSNDPEQFRQFIARYPGSFLVPDAQHWIERLEVNVASIKEELRKSDERKVQAERDARDAEDKRRLATLDAERAAKQEADRLAIAEAARVTAAAQEHVAKLAAEKAGKEEALRLAKAAEVERLAKLEADKEAARLARLEADRQQKIEAERLASVERERLVRVAAEKTAREEAVRVAKAQEVERLAAAERDRVAKVAADKAAHDEAVRVAKVQEAERLALVERDRLAKVAAEVKAHDEAVRLANADAERLAQIEADRRAQLARDTADQLARETAAREEAARIARLDADQRKADEVARLAGLERDRLAKVAADKAAEIEAGRLAALAADQEKQAQAVLLAKAEGERAQTALREEAERDAAQKLAAHDEEVRLARLDAERREAEAARQLAVLEQDRMAAEAALALAQNAERARLAAQAASPAGESAVQQFAALDLPTPHGEIDRNLGKGEAAAEPQSAWGSVFSAAFAASGPVQSALAGTASLAQSAQGAGIQVAALNPNGMVIYPTDIPPTVNSPEVLRAMQVELKRVGCLYGNETGTLNKRTRAALDDYAKANGYGIFRQNGVIAVTASFVDEMKVHRGIICAPSKPTTEARLPVPAEEVDRPVIERQRKPATVRRQPVPEPDVAPVHRRPVIAPVAREPRQPTIRLVAPVKVRPVASPPVSNTAVKMAPMTGF